MRQPKQVQSYQKLLLKNRLIAYYERRKNNENEKRNALHTYRRRSFMGSLICRELLERGEKVRTLVLTGNPAIEYIPSGAEIVEGDICDAASLDRLFAVPEGTETIVIHSAAIVSMTPEFDQKIMDVNVGGTQNIISQCLKHSECKKLVYVSSSGAIPEPPKGTKITETDHFLPIDEKRQVGCYCQSKAIATQYVLNACRDNGLNACVVHPTGIMGPETRQSVKPQPRLSKS